MAQGTPQLPPGTTSADPGLFQNLLNLLGGAVNTAVDTKGARYGAGAATAVSSALQGDLAGGIGAGVGTVVGGKLLGGLTSGIGNPYLRLGAQIGGSLLSGSIGSQLGRGVQGGLGQLVGGTQTAVGDAAAAIAGTQREAGTAAGTGKEAGLGGMSQQEYNQLMALKQFGVNAPAEAMERSYQVVNKMKDRDVGRQMQMNQQLAGLTAQLQRNLGGMQLAGQAMNVGGALTGQMLTSNPYAASVLQTGAIRGPMG